MIDWNKELDKVDEATKPISEGAHTFTITTATPASSSNGNPMIRLIVSVLGGPDDGKIGYPNVVFAFENPRAMKMTMKRLTSLGISEQMLRAENLSVEQIAARLIGRTVTGTVSHRMYNGEVQSDVDFIGGTPATAPGVPTVPNPAAAVPPVAPTVATPPTPTNETTPPVPDIPARADVDEEPF